MISIAFLRKPVAGLEFIDFQTTHFYDELTGTLGKYITKTDKGNTLSKDCEKEVLAVIERFTGFSNIKITLVDKGNMAVDTGFFSPNHVLNNAGVDELLKATKSTLYRWYTQNKEKMFKGSIDYSTGKVSGSFKTLPVSLQINENLDVIFPPDKVTKFGVPLEGIMAGAIAHELGHVFGGCMMLHTACSDNVVAKAGLDYYKTAERAEDRVVVLRDVASILELDQAKQAELQAIAQSGDEASYVMYFNKMIVQRNTSRSLSVGVERMSSEVIADMYALRMGCSKGIIAAISSLVDVGLITTVCNSLLMSCLLTAIFAAITPGVTVALALSVGLPGVLTYLGVMFTLVFMFDYFSKGYSNVYNADHRRFEDAMRQLIARFKEDKNISKTDKADLTQYIDKLLVFGKTLKPWYDNTVIYRFMGWVFNGSDFKKAEIEHYTQVLGNHEVNLMPGKLAALRARRDPDNIEGRDNDKTFEA